MTRLALSAIVSAFAAAAAADGPGWTPPVDAWFESPGDVYPHRILGSIPEYFVLAVRDRTGRETRVDLRDRPGPPHVFEDVAPRLADADGDGQADVVVVETDLARGAQLAVYSLRRGRLDRIAATPPIGDRFRWLAPVAIADLDGDGVTDLAYVETPHVAPRLRVWTWAPGGLTVRADLPGVTNHRIGDETISGGLRNCGAGPEMVLATPDWRGLVAVRLRADALAAGPVAGTPDAAGYAAALDCRGPG
ncbi:MAG: VCBS repeat-containing protein [Rhodobacteraceae bacterium]|nr:VCBS repeat-containing protein [Paracoccaceae bacterium]